MGGKKKYIEMFGSFTDPFNYIMLPSKLAIKISDVVAAAVAVFN